MSAFQTSYNTTATIMAKLKNKTVDRLGFFLQKEEDGDLFIFYFFQRWLICI